MKHWKTSLFIFSLLFTLSCKKEIVIIKEGDSSLDKPVTLNTFPFPAIENEDFTIQSFYTRPVVLLNANMDTLESYKSLNGVKINAGFLTKGVYFFKGDSIISVLRIEEP